jgi:hypothetical protein
MMRRRINAPFSPSHEASHEPFILDGIKRAILEGNHPIQAWRHQRAITSPKLAKMTGIDPTRLANLEREIDPPTDDELARLASALRAPLDMLVAPQDDSNDFPTGAVGHGQEWTDVCEP